MSTKPPRKALISISSFNGAIYPDNHKTGLFFTEALHPFEVLTAAGFEVDLASETGTFGPDDASLTAPFLSGSDKAILNNPKHPFMATLKSQLKKAAHLKMEEYGVFFASAGHAALRTLTFFRVHFAGVVKLSAQQQSTHSGLRAFQLLLIRGVLLRPLPL